MSRYLYGFSVNGIQSYIFETNELKTIVGASEIIKRLSKNDPKDPLSFEANYKPDEVIINAAGNIKVIFDTQEKAEVALKEFAKKVHQNVFGIQTSQALVKFEEGELKDAFQRLEKNLAIQKNKSSIVIDPNLSILKVAPKTARPIVKENKDQATLQKEAANTSTGNIPKNKKNKTAVIHADGNNLGIKIASMLKDLPTDAEVIQAYKSFSTKLDQATKQAYANAKEGIEEKDIREIILGGDDLSVICNANYALDFTKKFLEEFETQTQKLLGKDALTACAGIAFCNHKYPFHYAINLAEKLCSYAKQHSKKIDPNHSPSSLMFHNIQSANFNSFNEYIQNELTLKNNEETIHLNFGPYFVQEQKEYATIQAFLDLSEALKIKGSPLSRLREWLTILGNNAQAAQERLLRIVDMMELRDDIYKKSALEKALKRFHKKIKLTELMLQRDEKKYTPIADITTYLSVISYEKQEQPKE